MPSGSIRSRTHRLPRPRVGVCDGHPGPRTGPSHPVSDLQLSTHRSTAHRDLQEYASCIFPAHQQDSCFFCLAVTIAARTTHIASDVILIAVTWYNLRRRTKGVSRSTLTGIMYHDGEPLLGYRGDGLMLIVTRYNVLLVSVLRGTVSVQL